MPVEAEVIGPDRLAGLSASKVAAFPVQSGNRQARAGDFFRVSGKGDGEVRVARDVADHAVACPLSPAGGAPRRPPAGKFGLIPLAELWILEKIEFLVEEPGGGPMAWKSPKVVEIAVGMEINCYACAEL